MRVTFLRMPHVSPSPCSSFLTVHAQIAHNYMNAYNSPAFSSRDPSLLVCHVGVHAADEH